MLKVLLAIGTILALSTPVASAAGPSVLVFGSADNGSEGDSVASTLSSLGYSVDRESALPASLSSYSSIWYVEAYKGLTLAEEEALETYVQAGGSLYLTGERPCCEELNQSDEEVLRTVLSNKGVGVGGLGDISGPFTFNPAVEDLVASTPNTLVNFVPDSPGGMAGIGGISSQNVFASSGTVPVGAVFDEGDMEDGNGRIAILMDIDWLTSNERVPIIENIQNFLERGTGCSNAPPAGDPGFKWGGPANCTALVSPETVSWTIESAGHGPVTFTTAPTEVEANCSQAAVGDVGVLTCSLENASDTARLTVTASDNIGTVTYVYRVLPKNDPRNVPPGYSVSSNWWEWPDSDQDGIPDYWEEYGVWVQGKFLDLPAFGASPDHKDLFLHYDFEEAFELEPEVFSEMEDTFAKAPLSNPDGTAGVNLHIESGSSIPSTVVGSFGLGFSTSDIQRVAGYSGFTSSPEIGGGGVPQIFHWMLNRSPLNSVSPCYGYIGQSKLPGDFGFTAYASYCIKNGLNSSASNFALASNAMHELGHQLGLHHHGAADLPKYDTSYKSIMSYSFSTVGVPAQNILGFNFGHRIDYSRSSNVNLDWKMGEGAGSFTFIPGQWGENPGFYLQFGNDVIDGEAPAEIEPTIHEAIVDASPSAVREFQQQFQPEWRPDLPALSDVQVNVTAGTTTDVPLHGTDPEGSPLSYEVLGGATLGTATAAADGLSYAVPPGTQGDDIVIVRATNGTFSSDPATVTFHVSSARTSGGVLGTSGGVLGTSGGVLRSGGVLGTSSNNRPTHVTLARSRNSHGLVKLVGGSAIGRLATVEQRTYRRLCTVVKRRRRCGTRLVRRTKTTIKLKRSQELRVAANTTVVVTVRAFSTLGISYAPTRITRAY